MREKTVHAGIYCMAGSSRRPRVSWPSSPEVEGAALGLCAAHECGIWLAARDDLAGGRFGEQAQQWSQPAFVGHLYDRWGAAS